MTTRLWKLNTDTLWDSFVIIIHLYKDLSIFFNFLGDLWINVSNLIKIIVNFIFYFYVKQVNLRSKFDMANN